MPLQRPQFLCPGNLQVKTGQSFAFQAAFNSAQRVISSMPDYLGQKLHKCIERTDHYTLLILCEYIEHHEVGFRQPVGYQESRKLLQHFYDPFPTVLHYEQVAGSGPNLAFSPDGFAAG